MTALLACSDVASERVTMVAADDMAVGAGGPARARLASEGKQEVAQRASSAAQSIWNGMKLIRTAELVVEVDSVEHALRRADSIARNLGAFVADVQATHAEGRSGTAQLVVRVPSARFDLVMSALRAIGEIKNEGINTQDVTKEYADLGVRISAKQDAVTRLRELLVNRTAKLSDILDAERELARAVTELESLKGERQYYDERIAVSTISMRLVEPNVVERKPGWKATVTAAFANSVNVLTQSATLLTSVIAFLIPWTPFILIAWVMRRRLGWRVATPPTA
ncbi:MAG TPA: DUF4349 domain-containing protein [Gemmatimonadaceae bacterium]|nr:DUF4349 domain-containing protein [Gemmatimonadaceae bacterium]